MRLLPLLALSACALVSQTSYPTCDLEAALDQPEARVGDTLIATGGPFTVDWDTLVEVGGFQAADVAVSRSAECTLCDACIGDPDAECDACGACDVCAALCDPCVETVTFVVPSGVSGDVGVVVVNGFGSSAAAPLRVLADTSDADTSASDTDTSPSDTDAGADTAPTDTDTTATSATDSGSATDAPSDTEDSDSP